MVKSLVVILFLLLFSGGVYAQIGLLSISGIAVDSLSGGPVEFANVALRPQGAVTILTATTADIDGNFMLKWNKPGKYELVFAFVGYDTKVLPIELKGNLKLGKVPIPPTTNILQEAVITAERSEITISADKTVVNFDKSPSSQIGTADDALRNVPGISVDQDGNISITGKSGVKVLVDGRPNAMADNDLQGFLKSIPASSIESIEVITNPSARYDAEGNAGIINIKLKKGKNNGLNVSLSAGYGILNRYNGNFNINYRKNKFNVFSSYSANDSKTASVSTSNRTLTVNDTTTYYNYLGNGLQKQFSNYLKSGFDYYFDDNTTLTYSLGGSYSHSNSNTYGNSASLFNYYDTTASYNSFNESLGNNYSLNNNIAFTKKFDSLGRELDINAGHTYVPSASNATLNSLAYDSAGIFSPENSEGQKTNSESTLENIMVKADYTHPLHQKLEGYKIETGIKNETSINQNVFDDYDMVNGVAQYDTLLSNRFKYVQNVAAAYGIMSGSWKKWLSYSGGLRSEYTFINGNDNAVHKNYIDFFPSASLTAAFNDTQNLSFSYNRRIQRPPFRFINNAITYTDQFTTWQGNPLLQPSYSNNLSIAYSHSINKQLMVFRTGGTIVNNGFTGISSVDSNRITRGTEVNGSNSKAWNASFYGKVHITGWFEAQAYYNFSYTYYGFTEGINTKALVGPANNLWGSLRFKFWENTVFEVSGWYNTLHVNPQGTNLPVGTLYASLKKSFLKDKLTVSLAANDILNSMKWRWTVDNTGIQSTGSWQGTNRYLMLTFSYRFGSHDFEERKAKEEKEQEENEENGGKG